MLFERGMIPSLLTMSSPIMRETISLAHDIISSSSIVCGLLAFAMRNETRYEASMNAVIEN